MDEGFPEGRLGSWRGVSRWIRMKQQGVQCAPRSQWRARSAMDPPRPIPNRVVKHRSAEGTSGFPLGE
jgi:hypothetical protein